jgi:hypothetical protein
MAAGLRDGFEHVRTELVRQLLQLRAIEPAQVGR